MRWNGIHYDVGMPTIHGPSTRPSLPVEVMEREIANIAGGLHANAIRVTGDNVARIRAAGAIADAHDLEVWLSPMLPNAGPSTTLSAIESCARDAERLRLDGAAVTLVVGCELSVFMAGILPGERHADRLALLADPDRLMREVAGAGMDPQAVFSDYLATAVARARASFAGSVTYAAGLWEEVDWSLFDIVGVDAYRHAGNRETYADGLRAQARHARPVVVTEFGCTTYRGAADAGGMGWDVVDWQDRRLRDGIVRDEAAQAAEIGSLLDVLPSIGVDGAFVYTYVAPSYPASTDPAADLDTASFALVRSWPGGRVETKDAYRTIADRYGAR